VFEFLLGVLLQFPGDGHVLRALEHLRVNDVGDDGLVLARQILVQEPKGNSRYISYLDGATRKEKNKKYEGIKFKETNEKKRILNYDCSKVVATLVDGSSYEVFYTPAIIPSVTGYEYQFRDLPGLVLEYEAIFESGKAKVRFKADKIDMVPVPVAKFDIPKSGYRIL